MEKIICIIAALLIEIPLSGSFTSDALRCGIVRHVASFFAAYRNTPQRNATQCSASGVNELLVAVVYITAVRVSMSEYILSAAATA